MSVNGGKAKGMDRVPTPLSMAENIQVKLYLSGPMERAPSPLQMARLRKASDRAGV